MTQQPSKLSLVIDPPATHATYIIRYDRIEAEQAKQQHVKNGDHRTAAADRAGGRGVGSTAAAGGETGVRRQVR